MTTSGLLKCGHHVKCREQVRRDLYMTSLSSMMIWTLTPPRNRTFLQDYDHSWTEWMIDCERCWTVLRRFNARHWQTFYDLGNVYVFDIGSICIHGKELLRQFTFHQKYRENLTLKKMFEISEQLILEQSDEIFGVSQSAGKVLHGSSYQSLACKGLCILRFCVISWKDES